MNSDELAKDVLGAEELLEIQQERKVGGQREVMSFMRTF